jgi:uncharacterized membrane protein
MKWLSLVGVLTIFLGALYTFAPDVIQKLDEIGREEYFTVKQTLKYRLWLGVILILAGLVMVFVGFTVK